MCTRYVKIHYFVVVEDHVLLPRISNLIKKTTLFLLNHFQGKYQNRTGSTSCKKCGAGTFMLNAAADNSAATCQACKAGTYQDQEEQALCLPCTPGKYMDQTGENSTCMACPSNTYVDFRGATACETCPNEKVPNKKQTSCERPEWKTASDCGNSQYLNDSSTNNKDWICIGCPPGGACEGSVTIETLSPLFGCKFVVECPVSWSLLF